MLCSMTGFGRAEYQDAVQRVGVEIRSVNHRYLECSIRSPKKYHVFEGRMRQVLKEYVSRGKVDVFVTYEELAVSGASLQFQQELADAYLACAAQVEEQTGLVNDLTVGKLLSFPDVLQFTEPPQDEEWLWSVLEKVLREAAEQFQTSRAREGDVLQRDCMEKLQELESAVDEIVAHEPQILTSYQTRLLEKTKELLSNAPIEESRIAAEVVLYADKICTDEETVRLRAHIDSMRDAFQAGGSIGRKLDFLAQEMNREANTILSKAGDVITTDLGVSLKTGIEKIREQIQNIE